MKYFGKILVFFLNIISSLLLDLWIYLPFAFIAFYVYINIFILSENKYAEHFGQIIR